MRVDEAHSICRSVVDGGLGYLLSLDPAVHRDMYVRIRSAEQSVVSSWISSDRDFTMHAMGVCRYAAILVALAMEMKGLEPSEKVSPQVKDVVSKLEHAKIVLAQPIDWFASILMSGAGPELMKLVDFAKFLHSECSRMSLSPMRFKPESPAFTMGFDAYLFNRLTETCREGFDRLSKVIAEALKRNPLYIVRMFRDYEKALLDALNLRKTLSTELGQLASQAQSIAEEISVLTAREQEASRSIDRALALPSVPMSMDIEDLESGIRTLIQEREKLVARVRELEERIRSYESRLREKEEELKKLLGLVREEELARATLESEVENLRSLAERYRSEAENYRRMLDVLEKEKELLEEKVELLQKVLRGEEKLRTVPREEALYLEKVIRDKALEKFSKAVRIYDPLEQSFVEVSSWNLEKMSTLGGSEVVRSDAPMGLDIAYSHTYAEQDFDSKPMDLSEVSQILGNVSRECSEYELCVTVIASPTGFTKKVVDSVKGVVPGFAYDVPRHVVILFDPYTTETFFNESSPVARELARELAPLARADLIARVKEFVLKLRETIGARELPPYASYVELEEVVEEYRRAYGVDIDRDIVRASFVKLQDEGLGEMVVVGGRYTVFGFYR